jgi:hypothetical protein
MKIKTLEISGFHSALEALRLPYSLPPRSIGTNSIDLSGSVNNEIDNVITNINVVSVNKKDLNLLSTLVKRGPEHAKVLRGIVVYAKITAPIYIWCEIETYTVGHYRLSSESTMHTDCKGLSGEELQLAKASIPMGKELTKVDMFNYQSLRNIYFQRRNHRLPEWHEFCDYITTLPYAKELITIE